MYRIEDNSIVFHNGARIRFDDFIAEAIPFDDTIVLRLENQGWKKTNENVLAVDYNGNIKWRIARREYAYSECPYVQITRRSEMVDAYGWDGKLISIDPRFGNTLGENWIDSGAVPAAYVPGSRQYM